MDKKWKPKAWLAAILGFFLGPFSFLYINRSRLFWLFLFVTIIATYLDNSMLRNIENYPFFGLVSISLLLSILIAFYVYKLAETYDTDQRRRWYASWWIVPTGFIFSLVIVRIFFITYYSIPAASMSPTLNPKDIVFVNKWGFNNYNLLGLFVIKSPPSVVVERGDIVTHQLPEQNDEELVIDYVNRVIGLPGETVIYKDNIIYIKRDCAIKETECQEILTASHKLTQDKNSIDPDYVMYQESLDNKEYNIFLRPDWLEPNINYYNQEGMEQGQWIIPQGHYFVMGDNRQNSLDSRVWGFVPDENLAGKVLFIWN